MSDLPSRDEVEAKIAAAVAPIVNEMKWQRWLLLALVAAVASPKLGGPDAAQTVASLLGGVAQASGFH